MSRIDKTKCDFCSVETADHYEVQGWIQLSGSPSFSLSISIGRDEVGSAQTAFDRSTILDFCSIPCLVAYVERLVDDCDYEVVEE